MSSYLNSLLTTTTSRYNNLRRQLLSDDTDGDTDDDSHVSRVLRAYYSEKGRPFPPWLPPDPRAPQPAPAQIATSSGRQPQAQPLPMAGRAGGGLSDLWDSPPQPPQPQEPLSLRRTANPRGGSTRPLQGRPGFGSSLTPEPQAQGRPLPSQRAGSYQSTLAQGGGRPQAEASPPPSAGSATTAQERLKARLWGRSSSPAQGGARQQYDDRSNSYGSATSSSSSGRHQQTASSYTTSSNSPWVGNDDPYGPGYDNGPAVPPQRAPAGGRIGLPSGPRMR